MLEALENGVSDIKDFIDPNGEFDFTLAAGYSILRKFRAAIEAAKGDA